MFGTLSTSYQSGSRFSRRTIIGANVAIMIVVAIAVCGIVSYINNRHYHRFDCTAAGRFSLTNKTRNILKGLEKPVMISTLFNRGDRFTAEIFEQVSDILAEYGYQSDKLSIDHIDPLRERTKVEQLAKRINIEQIALNSVIFECEGRSKHADINELIERKFPFNFKGEEVFTSALLAVSQERQTGILFTTGHGERSMEDFNPEGLSNISNALKRDNYKVIPLDLLSKKEIPDFCDILVIAGPTKSFSTEELNIIRNYLDKDGKLLALLEPAIGRNKPSGLKELLKNYNVEIRDDAVIYNKVDLPLFGVQTVAEVYVSKDQYQEHKITKDMTTLTTVFFGAIPVNIAGTQDVKQSLNLWKLLQAPDRAWGETNSESGKKPENDREVDVQAPFNLAIAIEPADPATAASIAHGAPAPEPGTSPAKGPRFVVFGDSDFATNDYTGNYPGNLDIFLNSITWLAQKEAQLGISAKPQDFRQAVIKPIQMRIISWLTVFVIPAIGIVIGGIVWWERRR